MKMKTEIKIVPNTFEYEDKDLEIVFQHNASQCNVEPVTKEELVDLVNESIKHFDQPAIRALRQKLFSIDDGSN